jgi:hypothetical protein
MAISPFFPKEESESSARMWVYGLQTLHARYPFDIASSGPENQTLFDDVIFCAHSHDGLWCARDAVSGHFGLSSRNRVEVGLFLISSLWRGLGCGEKRALVLWPLFDES